MEFSTEYETQVSAIADLFTKALAASEASEEGELIGALNRPGFTGGRLAQMLGCIFGLVQAFIESFLRFVWRDVSDGTV
jgi:hypothetical protein